MSLNIINNIISTFCVNMKTDINSITIKNIEIEENYIICVLEFNDELYSIRHYEPIVMMKGVNYGMGPYHQYDIFDKKNKIFISLRVPF